MEETKVRKKIVFSGEVQGVGFRYRAQYLAQSMALTGWVKNSWDGSVEMEVQGAECLIEKLIVSLYLEPFIQIDDVEVTEIPVITECRFRLKE